MPPAQTAGAAVGVKPRQGVPPPARATAAPSPPVVEVSFEPEEKGWSAMIATMKHSVRAYALFDIAKLVLNKPERHLVRLRRPPAADGTRPPLFYVAADQAPCMSAEEALQLVLQRHANEIFSETRRPVQPPKGNFTCICKCGLTGEILGPPNHHEYPMQLLRHYQQRLRHIPFEQFKARIQTIQDEAAIKAWIESKSFVTEYRCLLETESPVFTSRDQLEQHVREQHLHQWITSQTEVVLSGAASRQVQNSAIQEAIRLAWIAERRFPLKTAGTLSALLRQAGFHFFKFKGITYVSPIKPQRFEASAELTAGYVHQIISHLHAHPGCKARRLLHALRPPAGTASDTKMAQAPLPVDSAQADSAVLGQADAPAVELAATAPASPAATPAAQATDATEQDQILADLHWLIRAGYVVEFADGRLWAPPPKPAAPSPTATAASATASAKPPTSGSADASERPASAPDSPAGSAEPPVG